MSYADGMAALKLEKPATIPRTEYSADFHWDLVNAELGTDIQPDSPDEEKRAASQRFRQAWDYSFAWATPIGRAEFGDKCTSMGHAVYQAGGTDFNTDIHQLYDEPEDVLDFDPFEVLGERDHDEIVARLDAFYDDSCARFPGEVNMVGCYITLVSGMIDLFGWDMLLLAAGVDAERFGAMVNRYAKWMQQYYNACADCKSPVIMSHDDMVWTSGPFIHPDWYRKYVFPNFKRYYEPIREAGKILMFTSDGTYDMFLEDMIDCGVSGFCFEPTNDFAAMAERCGQTHALIGGIDTRTLLHNDKEQIRTEVERAFAIGGDLPGWFMNVGNHIPPNTPVDACQYYNELYMSMRQR